MSVTNQLLQKYPIVSDQVEVNELRVVLSELEKLLESGVCGSVVEFGCYVGTPSLFIMRLLSFYNRDDSYHVFDSFEGLPEKVDQDYSAAGEQFKAGALYATKKQFIANFKKAGLPLPVIHKGWFSDILSQDVPENIIFAFLDGDYYESINDSFRLITPRLVNGAMVLVDDYVSNALPGAARATDEWVGAHDTTLRTQASLAVIGFHS